MSSWGGARCQREQVIIMGLMTLSPFIVMEETGGKGACSGGREPVPGYKTVPEIKKSACG